MITKLNGEVEWQEEGKRRNYNSDTIGIKILMAVLISMSLVFILPLVSAQNIYPLNEEVEIKFICTLNGAIPSASATYNFTISYPNGSSFINNADATAQGQGSFNYSTTFPLLGEYEVQSFCYDSPYSYSNTDKILINPSGEEVNGWTITIQIFVSLSALFLMILFLYLSSVKAGDKSENAGIKLFFVGLALVFLVAHIIITNIIVHDTLGISSISSAYTSVMYVFFTILILIFIYTMIRVTKTVFEQIMRNRGLR